MPCSAPAWLRGAAFALLASAAPWAWSAEPEAKPDGKAAVAAKPASQPAEPRNNGEAEFLVLGNDKLLRVLVQIDLAGKPATRVWGATFDWLMARADRNDDGRLNAEEVAQLPSPFHLRQILWGHLMPYSGPGPKLELLDTDQDGLVDRSELADYYSQTGLGSAVVAVGKAPLSDALTDVLLKRLDANNDDEVSETEWRSAYETLRKLDANDDEMIGPGELLPKASYPGVLASQLVTPPKPAPEGAEKKPENDSLPIILLPRRRQNTHWAKEVVRRRDADKDGKLSRAESGLAEVFEKLDSDKDGGLTPDELAAWRSQPVDLKWAFRFDANGSPVRSSSPNVTLAQAGRVQLELQAESGKLSEEAGAARRRMLSQFAEADANRDKAIVLDETTGRNLSDLRTLVEREDRNGDKQLSEAELTGWMDFQSQVASGHLMVSILDFGPGLFEFLDADHNGALASRELRTAWDRLKSAGCIEDGRFRRAALPHHLIGLVSHGRSVAAPERRRAGPAWFTSMDRNADGELSPREFLGPAADFRKMDRDGDGFVSAEEAAAAAPPAGASSQKGEPSKTEPAKNEPAKTDN